MSTIAALIAEAKELASPTTPWATRVSPIMERRLYDTVMGECVRPFEGLAQRFTCNIVSGTALYCTPPLDTIEAVYATLSDGDIKQIAVVHSHDARGGSAYTDPASGEPQIAIFEGLGSVRLDPTPNYNATAGLIIHGYGPYTAASYALTDECPLLLQDQIAVIRGIAYYLLEFIGDVRQVSMKEMYRQARAQIEINAHTYTAAHRMRGVSSASGSTPGQNPFNW